MAAPASGAEFLLGGVSSCGLDQCRNVSASCTLFNIHSRDIVKPPLRLMLPEKSVPAQNTRRVVPLHVLPLLRC